MNWDRHGAQSMPLWEYNIWVEKVREINYVQSQKKSSRQMKKDVK